MSSRNRLFSKAPEGTAVLFFIQIFATLGFAVLYSTLVLYATKHLQLSVKVATTLMGVFGAFNYGLHLFGGYRGGRFLSTRIFSSGAWRCRSSAADALRSARPRCSTSASPFFLPAAAST